MRSDNFTFSVIGGVPCALVHAEEGPASELTVVVESTAGSGMDHPDICAP